MNKSQKWMEIIKRFSNTGETGRCPDCGYEEKLEVIITDDDVGSVTFYCKGCNRYTQFDGRRIGFWNNMKMVQFIVLIKGRKNVFNQNGKR